MSADFPYLILHCRPGFEGDAAAELTQRAAEAGLYGFCRTSRGSGWVLFETGSADGGRKLMERVSFAELVFVRQWMAASGEVSGLPAGDRLAPLLPLLREFPRCGELSVESADAAQGERLDKLCRKLTSPFAAALRREGVLSPERTASLPRLHLFMVDGQTAWPTISAPDNSSPWPRGIPRLRFPPSAPSRSTLKLEEAFLHFLGAEERERLLAPGMRAVDLGAAPGGWTWQLVRRHMRVTAVDNGPMQEALLESGLLEHRREDGFRFRPERPVEWLVCDMVEQPSRVAQRMARWFVEGWCDRAIFNLKLPMKKRWQAVEECRTLLEAALAQGDRAWQLRMRQLYHDREEITCYLAPA